MTDRTALIEALERAEGRIVLGDLAQPVRNGSTTIALLWEAQLLPERVCEGGGWYSAHPTSKVWHVNYWPEHKTPRRYLEWPRIAGPHDHAVLADALAVIELRERKRYGFDPALRASAAK